MVQLRGFPRRSRLLDSLYFKRSFNLNPFKSLKFRGITQVFLSWFAKASPVHKTRSLKLVEADATGEIHPLPTQKRVAALYRIFVKLADVSGRVYLVLICGYGCYYTTG